MDTSSHSDPMLRIKLPGKDLSCTFDRGGNVYFAPVDKPDDLYEMTITRENRLLCEKFIAGADADADAVDADAVDGIVIGELESCYDDSTLRGKILRQREQDTHDSDSGSESESESTDIQKTYYSEDIHYNMYLTPRDTTEPYCSFSFAPSIPHEGVIRGEATPTALYDTLVYEGNPERAQLIAKTTLHNDTQLYRLCVFTSGDVRFRPIGSPDQIYCLHYDETGVTLR